MKIPGSPSTLRRIIIAESQADLAIDDYVGRYADCYNQYNEATAALNADLAAGKLTGEEFDELWNDATMDFQACRDLVDSDHDMFEEDWKADSTVGMQF